MVAGDLSDVGSNPYGTMSKRILISYNKIPKSIDMNSMMTSKLKIKQVVQSQSPQIDRMKGKNSYHLDLETLEKEFGRANRQA